MSTGINIAPSSDLTVGTTAVTSGTDGRVFFQAGGVIQQDANFTYDNTLKRLGLKAVGTAATDIPFQIQNSAGTANLMDVIGDGNINFRTSTTGATATINMSKDVNGAPTMYLGSVGYKWHNFYTSNVYSALDGNQGYEGRIDLGRYNGTVRTRFVCSGDSYMQFSNLVLGATTAGARLDVRAQGALSTDIAFRVRNSADTQNLYYQDGTGTFIFRNNAGNKFIYWDGSNTLQLGTSGGQTLNINTESTAVTRITTTSDVLYSGVSTHVFLQYKNGNFQLEQTSGIAQTSGEGGLSLKNGTAPTVSSADRFIQYSADITAGNAAPHFRTEVGDIIKLYKQSSAGIATVGDLVTILTNLGLLG
jgi:hypothetical protein